MTCKLVNVSSKPREVEVRIFGNQTLIEESGPETLAPGQLTVTATPGGFNHAYCHFSVKGGKDTVRAGGSVVDVPAQVDSFLVPAD